MSSAAWSGEKGHWNGGRGGGMATLWPMPQAQISYIHVPLPKWEVREMAQNQNIRRQSSNRTRKAAISASAARKYHGNQLYLHFAVPGFLHIRNRLPLFIASRAVIYGSLSAAAAQKFSGKARVHSHMSQMAAEIGRNESGQSRILSSAGKWRPLASRSSSRSSISHQTHRLPGPKRRRHKSRHWRGILVLRARTASKP